MFGIKLKTWMENYIGRPRKKAQADIHKGKLNRNGAGELILESSESLAQSDTGISSGSQQILSSSTNECKEGYSTATTDSDKSGLIHCHTALSLPSPESAYSTGYSTDEPSPGGGIAPPEYYINIRTGKHYFPSPAPTPTTPLPLAPFPDLHNQRVPELLSPTPSPHPRQPPSRPWAHHPISLHPPSVPPPPRPQPPTIPPSHYPLSLRFPHSSPDYSTPKPPHASLGFFLDSFRKGDSDLKPPEDRKKKSPSPSRAKKWFRQPFHRLAHRRTDSFRENISTDVTDNRSAKNTDKALRYLSTSQRLSQPSPSPRQRNRIKTNPWLPTAPNPYPLPDNLQAIFPDPALGTPRNRSCTNTPLQNRKAAPPEPPLLPSQRPRHPLNFLNSAPDSAERSDEDLTFNELMGTYNDSYVFHKETDILSDSDPTDCDDYESDSEAEKGGDECDSHDDELDFIDNNASDSADSDHGFPLNSGKCTYHQVYPVESLLANADPRPLGKNVDPRSCSPSRIWAETKGRGERRRQEKMTMQWTEAEQTEGGRGRGGVVEGEDDSSLRRMVLRRVMGKSFRRGSGGSGSGSERVRSEGKTEGAGSSVCGAGGGSGRRVELVLADEEADERYRELIMEAENMFESLRNSPVVKSRKKAPLVEANGRNASEDSAGTRQEVIDRAPEQKEPERPPRKSPKSLVLDLPKETPRKPGELRLGTTTKNSFKARSSAHSPLDPLGPAFRNFAVFCPTSARSPQIIATSSLGYEPSHKFKTKPFPPTPTSPLVPIAFQSLDLGKSLAPYCPQSEPVKRKIYSFSKTYDRLLRHLEKNPPAFEDTRPHPHTPLSHPPIIPPPPNHPTPPPRRPHFPILPACTPSTTPRP